MRTTPRLALAGLLVAAAAASQGAQAATAHSHGIARLDVAVDSATIMLRLASPLESLLGFERAPRNAIFAFIVYLIAAYLITELIVYMTTPQEEG